MMMKKDTDSVFQWCTAKLISASLVVHHCRRNCIHRHQFYFGAASGSTQYSQYQYFLVFQYYIYKRKGFTIYSVFSKVYIVRWSLECLGGGGISHSFVCSNFLFFSLTLSFIEFLLVLTFLYSTTSVSVIFRFDLIIYFLFWLFQVRIIIIFFLIALGLGRKNK